jgi:hypothetical protein
MAQRYHGRNARLWVDMDGTGPATVVPFIREVKIDQAVDRQDATAFGDGNKVELAGLPDFKGTYAGYSDRDSAQLYTAALDGVQRTMIFYPDYLNKPSTYFYGPCYFDQSLELAVDANAKISGAFSAAGTITRIPN